ncbi:uncharacterized protein [Ptychodera flava]|uniref:uncharacterized protein n=1 Tax=Ptychodera flava TaxID=63121 RepID=UPI00396A2FB3
MQHSPLHLHQTKPHFLRINFNLYTGNDNTSNQSRSSLGSLSVILCPKATMATTPDIKAVINEKYQKAKHTFNLGDFKGMAQMYTADGKSLGPGRKTLNGRQEILDGYDNGLLGDQYISESVCEEVFGKHGDEFVTSRSSFKLTSKDGAKTITGKDVVVWKLVDGEYLAHVDIWNFDE